MTRRPSRTPRAGSTGRRSRRRLLVGLLVGVLALGLLGGAGWLVGFSSVLATDRVTVAGAQHLTAAQIRTAAQVPLGLPMVRQDLDLIAQRTTSLPAVEAARVTRIWPHTIKLTVTERRPLLAVPQPDGYAVVDHLGVAYENRSTMPSGTVRADVDPGNVALLRQVGVVVTSWPSSLRSKVRYVHATSRNDIEVNLTSGVVISWGDSSDSALKAKVATLVLKRHPRTHIDVSSPHTPALK